MEWKNLLCEKRDSRINGTRRTNLNDSRSEFQKDLNRIICSASFRRMQDKTQVFPLEQSDFVRTRLTHSLEVSTFGKTLGQTAFRYLMDKKMDDQITDDIKEKVCSILECAGLLHDIGNPPFGHFGEDSIRKWFENNLGIIKYNGKTLADILDKQMKQDIINFEGNAQALRLLTKLHYLTGDNGMQLTYALLNTLIKYPVSSCEVDKNSGNIKDKKIGYYYAEKDLFEEITLSTGAEDCRHPLTYLLEAADDIAYLTGDIEDAVKKGILSYEQILGELNNEANIGKCRSEEERKYYQNAIEQLKKKYKTARDNKVSAPGVNAVQNWIIHIQGRLIYCASFGFTKNYRSIMNGTYNKSILEDTHGNALSLALKNIAREYVFNSIEILKTEVTAGNIISYLLDKLVPAVIYYEKGKKLSPMDHRLLSLISPNYLHTYDVYSEGKPENEKLYLRLLLVTDYVCGMTDSFAKRLYQELSGII